MSLVLLSWTSWRYHIILSFDPLPPFGFHSHASTLHAPTAIFFLSPPPRCHILHDTASPRYLYVDLVTSRIIRSVSLPGTLYPQSLRHTIPTGFKIRNSPIRHIRQVPRQMLKVNDYRAWQSQSILNHKNPSRPCFSRFGVILPRITKVLRSKKCTAVSRIKPTRHFRKEDPQDKDYHDADTGEIRNLSGRIG